jgi:hypothetical protein
MRRYQLRVGAELALMVCLYPGRQASCHLALCVALSTLTRCPLPPSRAWLKSRWFPDGQIVFLAPTKPLVTQQVTACHEAAGIPASATAQLLGNVRPSVRAELWKSKRCALSLCAPMRRVCWLLDRGLLHNCLAAPRCSTSWSHACREMSPDVCMCLQAFLLHASVLPQRHRERCGGSPAHRAGGV